jgi:hypothetical protein
MNKYIFLIFFFTQQLMGHTINRPVDQTQSTGNTRPSTHSGFGYLNTSSEAQAAAKLNLVCPDDDRQAGDSSTTCNAFSWQDFSDPAQEIDEFYYELSEEIYEQTIRDKAFDYLVLQKAGLSTKRPVPITKPSCVSKDVMSLNLPVMSGDETKRTEEIVQLQKSIKLTKDKAKKKQLEKQLDVKVKLNSIQSNQSPKRLAQALILDDQYSIAWMSTDCMNTTKPNKLMKCTSLKELQTKLRQSFPAIFTNSELIESNVEFVHPYIYNFDHVNYHIPNTDKQEKLRKSIKILIGSHNNNQAQSSTSTELFERGSRLYQSSVDNQYGVGWDENSVDNLFNDAYDAAVNGEYDPIKGVTVAASTIEEFSNTVEELKERYNEGLNNELGALCKTDMKDLTKLYPQVLKQMLLDSDEYDFDQTKDLICKNNLEDTIISPMANSCVGVSGDIYDPKGMIVKRMEYSFPFGGKKHYNIKMVGKDLIVSTTINFKFIYDSSLPTTKLEQKSEFDKKILEWKDTTNDYFLSLKSKMNPPVIFNYEVGTDTSTKPVVNVSTCYNRKLPKADQHSCDKVKQLKNGANWMDAGNFTLSINPKTLAHEMGHQLGLDDEYSAGYYPMNNLGEKDSIMSNGLKLYPRHIQQIIGPALRCGSTTREELMPKLNE